MSHDSSSMGSSVSSGWPNQAGRSAPCWTVERQGGGEVSPTGESHRAKEEKKKTRTAHSSLRARARLPVEVVPAILSKIFRRLAEEMPPRSLEEYVADETAQALVVAREAERFRAGEEWGSDFRVGRVVREDGLEELFDGAIGEVKDVCRMRRRRIVSASREGKLLSPINKPFTTSKNSFSPSAMSGRMNRVPSSSTEPITTGILA
jgi:hypothetical protein